ncbi:MAG: hypothetical protein ABGY42_11450 [bacterium]
MAQSTREKPVVIGSGMAGTGAGEELLERDPERFAVTAFDA